MTQYVQEYLEAKRPLWRNSTFKTESARLRCITGEVNPDDLYRTLRYQGRALYSIKTLFIRLMDLERWCISKGYTDLAPLEEWYNSNKFVFRHSYQPEVLQVNYETARTRITSISNVQVRAHLEFLLKSGVRISESYEIDNSGYVIGKGGKRRRVFIKPPTVLVSQTTLRRALTRIGLKPHSLRKLCATRLLKRGANLKDVCEILGWSNLNTANKYVQAADPSELRDLL